MPSSDPFLEPRSDWLDVLDALDAADFTAVADFSEISAQTYFESLRWDELLFREGAGPHREAGDVRHAYHIARPDTIDLLRHEYAFEGIELVVTESAAFTHIRCGGYSVQQYGGDPDPLVQAAALAAALLKIPDAVSFTPIPGDPKYRSFSSQPAIGPARMEVWSDRIDGVVESDGIVLLCYKRHLDYDEFVNLSTWFDANFRAAAGQP